MRGMRSLATSEDWDKELVSCLILLHVVATFLLSFTQGGMLSLSCLFRCSFSNSCQKTQLSEFKTTVLIEISWLCRGWELKPMCLPALPSVTAGSAAVASASLANRDGARHRHLCHCVTRRHASLLAAPKKEQNEQHGSRALLRQFLYFHKGLHLFNYLEKTKINGPSHTENNASLNKHFRDELANKTKTYLASLP